MSERKGDWMTTFTGRQFWPLDPRPEEVCIEDIAHALANICRFGGHCKRFYSVAQHSILVADLVAQVEPQFRLAALLHDAPEAYIGDMVRPLKRFSDMGELFTKIEHVVALAIWLRYNLPVIPAKVLQWADDLVLKYEHAQLINDGRMWAVDTVEGPAVEVCPWSPSYAEVAFLGRFKAWGA